MKSLRIDEKWSVDYDPENNDRPVAFRRYGEDAGLFTVKNNYVAMHYALLERDAEIARLRKVLGKYRDDLCEGFCGDSDWSDAGHACPYSQTDCGGCLAAATLLGLEEMK